MTRPAVSVFCRAPVPGRTKTRLIGDRSPEAAAALGVAMLLDVVSALRSEAYRLRVAVSDPAGRGPVAALLPGDIPVDEQPAGDLGARMAGVIAAGLAAGRPGVAIVGSDCPGIGGEVVLQALSALEAGADLVISPARDGGYSLVAARREIGPVLRDIPWSTDSAAAATLAAARREGLRVARIAGVDDIDRPRDLTRFLGDPLRPSTVGARTRAVAAALDATALWHSHSESAKTAPL